MHVFLPTRPILALVVASFLWGTADVAGKLVLEAIPPVTLAAVRFSIALVMLWLLAHWRGDGCCVPARIAAPLGLLGVALAFLLQNVGLGRTTAANASLLQGAAPVLVLVLAMVLLRERPGPLHLGGAATALVGIMTVTLPGSGGLRMPGSGDTLVLASTACFATFAVLGRRAFPVYGTLPVLVTMMAWGTAILVPASAVELLVTQPAPIGLRDATLVLYLGAGCSAVTYVLWGFALRHLEAGRAVIFDNLVPVVGCAAAVLVLRETPTTWQVTGGVLVVAGVWLTTRESTLALTRSTAPPGRKDDDLSYDQTGGQRPAVLGTSP